MNQARKDAVTKFLREFDTDTVYHTEVSVELTDHGLRLLWTGKGPDDIYCGICVIKNDGSLIFKGLNHLAFDDTIHAHGLYENDHSSDEDVWENPNISLSQEDEAKIQEFIGSF